MLKRRRIIRFWRLGNQVDGYTRPVRSRRERLISVLEGETFNKGSSKVGLVEMHGHWSQGNVPREVDAKEPVYNAHKVDLAALSKKSTEKSFDCQTFGKINKVVNIETKRKRRSWTHARRIGRVDNETWINAWALKRRSQTDGLE
jgi:hypothetical protein